MMAFLRLSTPPAPTYVHVPSFLLSTMRPTPLTSYPKNTTNPRAHPSILRSLSTHETPLLATPPLHFTRHFQHTKRPSLQPHPPLHFTRHSQHTKRPSFFAPTQTHPFIHSFITTLQQKKELENLKAGIKPRPGAGAGGGRGGGGGGGWANAAGSRTQWQVCGVWWVCDGCVMDVCVFVMGG